MKNAILFLFSLYFYSITPFSCPNGYIEIPNEHKCVYPSSEVQYYPRAVRKCKDIDGDVVKIENIFENSILFGLLEEEFNGTAPYIGVEKLPNGTWVYSDGSPLTYSNWSPDQPTSNNNATICAIMDPQTTKWRPAECSIPRPFFCQINVNDAECDPGWVYYDKTDHCYYLHNFTYQDGVNWQLYSWNDAEGNCRRMNSHLLSIHSKDEDDFIYDLVYTSFNNPTPAPAPTVHPLEWYNWAFIGLNARGVPGDYWVDGTPFDYFDNSVTLPTDVVTWAIQDNPYMDRRWGWLNWSLPRFICKKVKGQ